MVKKTQKNTAEVEALKLRVEELERDYRRALADYQNQHRRHQEQESAIVRMASAILIEKLLLNIDALVLAQSHLKDQGLQMVIKQFMDTFSQEGLKPIESDGKDFDPLIMDCVDTVPGDKDKVVETVSPGYYLYEKVLRPAKVKVGNGQ